MLKSPERYVFVIIDSIFNSRPGLRRSKELAAGLVNNASPGDNFIVLSCNPGSGLQYKIGPTKNKKKLTDTITKIKLLPVHRRRMKSPKKAADYLTADKRYMKVFMDFNPEKPRKDREHEKFQYVTDMKYLSKVLVDLKYALKTITRPKMVYFISEGVSRGAFKEEGPLGKPPQNSGGFRQQLYNEPVRENQFNTQQFYFTYLKNVAKALNDGGTVMYTLNSRRMRVEDDYDVRGDDSLKFLADESGGQYFRGMDIENIITRVKKSTAAYYEIFFHPESKSTANMKFSVRCERKGVKVHSIVSAGKERSYADMPKIQKKMFAYNLVTAGTWSRMVAKIDKLKYKKLKAKTIRGKTVRDIKVTIPQDMIGKQVDVFVLNLNPVTMKADIALTRRTAGDSMRISVPVEKGKKPFVAVIEPNNVQCIYNIVRI